MLNRFFSCSLFLVVAVFILTPDAAAKIIYVDDDVDTGNGTSWAMAFNNLQDALADAEPEDEIRVAHGIYKPDQGSAATSGDRQATFLIVNGIAIYGGYAGINSPDPDDRNFKLYETTISGDLSGDDEPNLLNNSENSYCLVTFVNSDTTTILDGFTISGGNNSYHGQRAQAYPGIDDGGGVYIYEGSPTIANCIFRLNSADYGGGICNDMGSPTVANSIFESNRAGQGGAIYNYNGRLTAINCFFQGNTGDLIGGGLCNDGNETATLINCTLSENTANIDGGGISNQRGSTSWLTNCVLWGNSDRNGTDAPSQIVGPATVTYSCVQDADPDDTSIYPGTGNIDDDPLITFGWQKSTCYLSHTVAGQADTSPCVDSGSGLPSDHGLDGFSTRTDGVPDTGTTDIGFHAVSFVGSPVAAPEVVGMVEAGAVSTIIAADLLIGNITYVTNATIEKDRVISQDPSAGAMLHPYYALDLIVSLGPNIIIYVDDDADTGGDGASWATAYNQLQDALLYANYGDTIHVAQGSYTPDLGEGFTAGDRDATFQLINGVALRGGFAGIGAADPDARNIELYETILTGDLDGNDTNNFTNYYENSYHVVTGSYCDSAAVLEGFTITGGNAYENSTSYGAGIYNIEGSPTISNCVFRLNTAYRGGAVYNKQGNPILTNCVFDTNNARYGGAMFNDSADPVMINCSFSYNTADYGAGMYNDSQSGSRLTNCSFTGNIADDSGGGMYNNGSDPVIIGCGFSANSASENGGGMYNIYSDPTLTGCDFSNNTCLNDAGGMYNEYSNPTLTDCNFNSNLAVNGDGFGGGMLNEASNPILLRCDFNGNMAAYSGGGMYSQFCNPTLTDCTFIGNSAESGGGLFGWDSDSVLTNCTFISNTAELGGGGVRFYSHSNPTLDFCQFSNNSAGDRGGGLANAETDAIVTNCTFDSNTATHGSGMFNMLSNPTITDCSFNNNSGTADGYGGGMVNYYGTVILTDCDFSNNSNLAGGGLYNYESNVTISNSFFTGNQADYGGGLLNDDGDIEVVNCRFDANTAEVGGGTYLSLGEPIIDNCTFSGNVAVNGGGLFVVTSSPTIMNSIFSGNVTIDTGTGAAICNAECTSTIVSCVFVDNTSAGGGGIYNDRSSDTIIDCIFSNNTVQYGGGIYNNLAHPVIANSIFTGNEADNKGGGIANSSARPIVTNCLFSGNKASDGGAINNYKACGPTVINSTFIANSASHGSSLAYNGSLPGSLLMRNCIVWDWEDEISNGNSSSLTVEYSNIRCGWPGEGNTCDNPQFAGCPVDGWTWSHSPFYDNETFQTTLTDITSEYVWEPGEFAGKILNPNIEQTRNFLVVDNTDTTITVWGDVTGIALTGKSYEIFDFSLTETSPGVDAGYLFTDAGELDLDGNPRYQDANDSSGWDGAIKTITYGDTVHIAWKRIDMGAYELQPENDIYDTFTVQATDNLDTGTWQDLYSTSAGTWSDTGAEGIDRQFYRILAE